jgi:hypothetical protein
MEKRFRRMAARFKAWRGTGGDGFDIVTASSEPNPRRSIHLPPHARLVEAWTENKEVGGARSAADSRDRGFNLCIGSFGPIPFEVTPHEGLVSLRRFIPSSSGNAARAGAFPPCVQPCGGEAWSEDEAIEQNPSEADEGQGGGSAAHSAQHHESILQANSPSWSARPTQATSVTSFHGDGRGKSSDASNVGAICNSEGVSRRDRATAMLLLVLSYQTLLMEKTLQALAAENEED